MDVSQQMLFFFSALGVFNALLIVTYFFFYKKPKRLSNYFFGITLLMLATRVGKSVFYYFNSDLSREFLQLGISACLLIGPALYFFFKTSLHSENRNRNWIFHFGLGATAILIGIIWYPWTNYPHEWRQLVGIVYWIWFAYLIASAYLLRNVLSKIFRKSEKFQGLDRWHLSVFFGIFIIWFAYRTSVFTSYIVGALSFSFVFYLLFLLIHFNRKKISIFREEQKYADKKIDDHEAKELAKQLNALMSSEDMYKDANLKLKDVAKKLNIIPHRLSQLLNDNLNKSFTQYVNEYRIAEAKRLIKSNDKLTLEAIGYECGFNSKSTFYATFKKLVGKTPSQFKSED